MPPPVSSPSLRDLWATNATLHLRTIGSMRTVPQRRLLCRQLNKACIVTIAEHGELSPALLALCEATCGALTGASKQELLGSVEPTLLSVTAAASELQPGADAAESHAELVTQRLLGPAVRGQQLADAVALEACAAAVADVYRIAAGRMLGKNPYHEILAGASQPPSLGTPAAESSNRQVSLLHASHLPLLRHY